MTRNLIPMSACAMATLLIVTPRASAEAQIRVNPTGVSVNAMNATTVFLTFGTVPTHMRPAEAFWCGELMSAAPDRGNRCTPSSIFGQLPARYNLAQTSGTNGFTDIMSIPASVSRRAYQDARSGAVSTFFYVRRFESVNGGPDEFVAVTCRLTSGDVKVPFSLTDVRVAFDGTDEVQTVRAGETLPNFSATITHNGTGRLIGRWEVVMPGEAGPSEQDLLTQASLPAEQRNSQRRFAQVQRFSIFVPPGAPIVLRGPDPVRLPTSSEGQYLVLLRFEASDDREGDSDLGAVGAGTGILHSGAVAGFPMPVLRYVVLGDGTSTVSRDGPSRLALLEPADGAGTRADSSFRVRWNAEAGAQYRIELQSTTGAPILAAIVPTGVTHYDVPSMAWTRANDSAIRWRVIALDASGRTIRLSGWRRVNAGVKSLDMRSDAVVLR